MDNPAYTGLSGAVDGAVEGQDLEVEAESVVVVPKKLPRKIEVISKHNLQELQRRALETQITSNEATIRAMDKLFDVLQTIEDNNLVNTSFVNMMNST